MKPNKSIDGLATRDAKNSTSKIFQSKEKNLKKKPDELNKDPLEFKKETEEQRKDPLELKAEAENLKKKPDDNKKTKESNFLKDTILEDSLEIKVEDDLAKESPALHKTELVEEFLAPVEAFNLGNDKKDEEFKKETKEKSKKDKKPKKAKKDKKIHKTRRIVLITILTILILLSGLVVWGIFWGNDIIAKITGGQGNVFDIFSLTEEKYDPLKTDSNGRTNILVFGTSGYNMDGDEGNGTHAGAQLTDSIMMISLNQETGDIAMLSLPRDLKASPTCTSTGKINEVYWCNGGSGNATMEEEATAANALMTEVGSILGVDFQYYVHLNWGSLVQIVDTLGGITVVLDEDINDFYWTGAVFEAGKEYTINGEQALGLARARHGTAGGDFSRGSSQQKILIGIKNKVFEKNLTIPEILSLASTLGDNLRSNFSLQEFKTLAHFSSEFDFDNMRQISLYNPDEGIHFMTTGTINEISYVLPAAGVGNYGAIQEYVRTNLSNDPRVYENASIVVLNATDEAGLAASMRDTLENEEGFNIAAVDNAETGYFERTYNIYVLNDKVKGTVDLLEKYFNTSAFEATDLPEGITTDYDIVIVLGPSPAATE